MQPSGESPTLLYEAFDAGSHLSGVVEICRSLERDSFRYDPDLTRKSLTAPGVTILVAAARDTGEVVGFARAFSDGIFQAHLGLLAVDEKWRRRGIGRRRVEGVFARVGAERMDLTSSDEAPTFYRSFRHREQAGFRMYSECKAN